MPKPASTDDEMARMVANWVKALLIRAGIRVVDFSRGDEHAALGLIGVPAKYCGVIDAMHAAIDAVAHGEPLPTFTPLPAKASKAKRRR